MDNKAFVFSGFALLLVIPAVILAASLFNMMYYGSTGIRIAMVGDEVFYSCQNLIEFLQDGSMDGRRGYVLEQAELYAEEHGMNFTNETINATYFQIVLESPGGLTCNKTIELRFGTLLANLTLYDWNTTVGGVPVYFRKSSNNIVNSTANVTYSNSSCVSGATVTLGILGETKNMSQTSCGIYGNLTNITALVDDEDDCTTKFLLGFHTAEATAQLTKWYDGSDSESFLILGDMRGSTVEGYKPAGELGVKITLIDEYDDPVTRYYWPSQGSQPDCDGNYTSPMPDITARIYEDCSFPDLGVLKATYVSPTNISEDEPPGDSGIYQTASGYSFDFRKAYCAVVNVTHPDYIPFNWQGEISFTDLEATNVIYGKANEGPSCEPGGSLSGPEYGVKLNITNAGTTDKVVWDNYTITFSHTNASNIFYNYTYDYYPGGKKRGGSWFVCSNEISLTNETIFANITSVGLPNLDVDLTNNNVTGTA